jgi:hypothetical protein
MNARRLWINEHPVERQGAGRREKHSNPKGCDQFHGGGNAAFRP